MMTDVRGEEGRRAGEPYDGDLLLFLLLFVVEEKEWIDEKGHADDQTVED